MAFEVLMPQLGLTMEEGTVSQWAKHEGDPVKTGDVLLEITTDKLTNEVASEHDGVMLKIVAQEGEDIPVKGLLAYIGQPGEAVGGAAPAAAPAAPVVTGAGEPVTAPMPGTILKVNVTQGQAVKAGTVLCILEAMKMENEIMTSKDGTVTQVLVSKGSAVDTGAPLVVIG